MTKYLCQDVFDIVIEYAVVDITIFPSDSRWFKLLLRHRQNTKTYDQLVRANRIDEVRLLKNYVGKNSLIEATLNNCEYAIAKIILEHMELIQQRFLRSYKYMAPITRNILNTIINTNRYDIMDLIDKYPYIWGHGVYDTNMFAKVYCSGHSEYLGMMGSWAERTRVGIVWSV